MDSIAPLPWHLVHTPDRAFDRVTPSQPSRVVYSFPHSGRYYPDSFVAQARPQGLALRMSEDAFIDNLVGFGQGLPVWGLRVNYPRAFVDVNRNPLELDARLIRGQLPRQALSLSARVKAGFGVVARRLNAEADIYTAPLEMEEVSRRIELIHRPYHEALTQMIVDARRATGTAILVDWHSMPSSAVSGQDIGGAPPDIVLGTLHGESCSDRLWRAIKARLEGEGLRVGMNKPFAGGYILERYGRPAAGIEAVQIEVNRRAYMNEETLELNEGFDRLSTVFGKLTADLNAL